MQEQSVKAWQLMGWISTQVVTKKADPKNGEHRPATNTWYMSGVSLATILVWKDVAGNN